MAEFDPTSSARCCEGMRKPAIYKGRQPHLSALQRKHLPADYESGEYTADQFCEITRLSPSSMYAIVRRARAEKRLIGTVNAVNRNFLAEG